MNHALHPAARRFAGIRARLSLVVLLAIVPLAAYVTYDAYRVREAQLAEGRANLQALVALIAEDMETRIASAQTLLHALAEAPAIRRAQEPACSSLLAGILKQTQHYSNIIVARDDGEVLCGALAESRPANYGAGENFRRMIETRLPVVGKPIVAPLTKEGVVPVLWPILDAAGNVDKASSLGIRLSWVGERVAKMETFAGTALIIWNENRTVLYRYPDNDRYFGQMHAGAPLLSDTDMENGGIVEAFGLDGLTRVFARARLNNYPGLGLTIAVGTPIGEIAAGANRNLIRDLVLLGILALAGLAGARVLGEVLVRRPVGALAKASRRLAGGDAGVRIGAPYAGGELGALARDFDQMAEHLERRQAMILAGAEELKRVNRVLKVLIECNQALVHASSESQLLHDICNRIVRFGGYRMAWVGLVRDDAQCTIEPVASAGDRDRYLDAVRISWADNEFGRGPAGRAVRTGAAQITNDIAVDPLFTRWREEALARGYRAAASLPLLGEGKTRGVLGLFAAEPAAFDAKEFGLLQELAEDVAFGMQSLRTRAERNRAEEALRTNEERLRQLSRSLFAAEEDQRRLLARELHDRIGQNVTALALNLSMLRSELPIEGQRRQTPRLDDCDRLIDDTAKLIRNVMVDLRPPGLDELGLRAALNEHAREFSGRSGFAATVRGTEVTPRLPPGVEITLFRIAQEALTNVAKHARATEVTLALESGPESVTLTIADNGRGFDPAARPERPSASLGLVGMRERAESIGARLRVESAPGEGARVIVEAPCAASPPAQPGLFS